MILTIVVENKNWGGQRDEKGIKRDWNWCWGRFSNNLCNKLHKRI